MTARMRERGRKRLARVVLAVIAVAAAVGTGASAASGTTTSYGPPFHRGPISQKSVWNYQSANPAGRVAVGRVYVIPAIAGCGNGSPFAKLQITHHAKAPVTAVAVKYNQAAVDPYTFLRVGVRDTAGNWLATKAVRGPVANTGTVTVAVGWPAGLPVPKDIVVEFGLEQAGACPSADFGTVNFTQIRVTE
jgi:hypothetical protein